MGDDNGMGIVFAVGLAIGLIVGVPVGFASSSYHWEKECVERGGAHYDAKTGEWKWNEVNKP